MKWRYPSDDDREPIEDPPVEDFRTALRKQELRHKLSLELDEWRYHPKDVNDVLDRVMDLIDEFW